MARSHSGVARGARRVVEAGMALGKARVAAPQVAVEQGRGRAVAGQRRADGRAGPGRGRPRRRSPVWARPPAGERGGGWRRIRPSRKRGGCPGAWCRGSCRGPSRRPSPRRSWSSASAAPRRAWSPSVAMSSHSRARRATPAARPRARTAGQRTAGSPPGRRGRRLRRRGGRNRLVLRKRCRPRPACASCR